MLPAGETNTSVARSGRGRAPRTLCASLALPSGRSCGSPKVLKGIDSNSLMLREVGKAPSSRRSRWASFARAGAMHFSKVVVSGRILELQTIPNAFTLFKGTCHKFDTVGQQWYIKRNSGQISTRSLRERTNHAEDKALRTGNIRFRCLIDVQPRDVNYRRARRQRCPHLYRRNSPGSDVSFSKDLSELNLGDSRTGVIMSDLAANYRSEAFPFETSSSSRRT